MTENQIQRAVFANLKARGAPGVFAFAIPNGGYRRPVEAAILKSTGTKAGVPDVALIKGGTPYFLELKADKGRLSPAQKACLTELANSGAQVGVAFGLNEALAWLESHGLLKGKAR